MNEKRTLQDIVDILVKNTGADRQICEDFVRNFFESITDSLEMDSIVKIKGFGTFKLTDIEERKSVNVQTGDTIIIPSHQKVTFLPDKIFKEAINAPYAHLMTYVVKPDAPLDPPENDDEQDSEDVTEELSEDSENVEIEEDQNKETSVVEKTQETVPVQHADWFDNWEVEDAVVSEKKTAEPVDDNIEPYEHVIESQATSIADVKIECEHIEDNQQLDEHTEQQNSGKTVNDENQAEQIVCESSESEDSHPLENSEESPAPAENKSGNKDTIDVTESTVIELENIESISTNVCSENNQKQFDNISESDNQQSNVSSNTSPELTPTIEDPFKKKHKKEINRELTPEEEKKKKKLGVGVMISVILLVGFIISMLIFSPEFFSSLRKNDSEESPMVQPLDTTSLVQELNYETAETVHQSDSDSVNVEVNEPVEEKSSEKVSVSKTYDERWSSKFVTYMAENHPDIKLTTNGEPRHITIVKGLLLTQVSLKFYGDKKYWIYLYLYNTNVISNPNNVRINTKILVPNLDKTLVDVENPVTLDVAGEVRQAFLQQ